MKNQLEFCDDGKQKNIFFCANYSWYLGWSSIECWKKSGNYQYFGFDFVFTVIWDWLSSLIGK